MEKLRKELNFEEWLQAFGHPSLYQTAKVANPLHCQACAQLYFVDDDTYRKALSGLVAEGSEIRFICDVCENEYAAVGRGD